MMAVRWMILAAAGLAAAGCANNENNAPTSLPKPLYALQQTPPAYRKSPEGTILDNADVHLDAQGYRVDKKGQRIQEVDIPAKTAGQTSNPVAGYYISSTGTTGAGNVMAPSVGAGAGVGSGPGSAMPMPSGEPVPQMPSELLPTPGEGPPAPR